MKVGRFQVMAVLQAARAYTLGLSLESAKSWGLNRAIFYAAAKRGFLGGKKKSSKIKVKGFPKEKAEKIEKTFDIFRLGDEMAYSVMINGKRYFVMGNQIQTEKDFEKNIERRFRDKFKKAWEEALKIVRAYDKGVLLSQRYFFETVYKPRRDVLAKKWTEMVSQD